MKKTLFLLCSTMLLWMGCTEDDSLKNENTGFKTIGATIEQGGANSRVQITDNNGGATLSWSTGDAFTTFGDITAEYTYDGSIFNASGGYPQTINYAVYPSAYRPTINTSTLTMSLSTSFDNVENQSKVPMWAGTPVSYQLSFKHLAALLKIDLTGIEEYTTIEVAADKAIAGSFTADLSVENPVLSPATDNNDETNKTVTITLVDNATDGAEVIYLPIPAGTYASLKVTAKGEDVTEKELKSWANLSFERAKMYTASIVNLSTPAGVSEVLEDLGTTPVVLNLPAGFTTEGESGANTSSITIPNVTGSDLTLSFDAAPTTSEENPLVIESQDETEVGESNKTLNISIPTPSGSNAGTYLEINTPTTTATVSSGSFASLTATTATNTLIIKEGVNIDKLVVKGGNVVIEKGATVAEIENNGDGTIEYTFVVIENQELSDALFKLYGETYDIEINADGYAEMEKSEVLSITALDLQNYYFQYDDSISNLKGIEHFKNLIHLSCGMLSLEECDLSKNTLLQSFSSSWSNLTSLDLSNNSELTYVSLQNCQSLTSLDLTGCDKLNTLEVNGTALTSLDIPNKEGLRSLLLGGSLDISLDGFTSLKSLGLTGRNLTDLSIIPDNLKGNLTSLYVNENAFTSLDLSGFSSLSHLECRKNQITELSNFSSLRSIYCNENKIESLDVTACENLNELICGNQQEGIRIVLTLTADQKIKLIDNAYYPEMVDPETNNIELNIVE